jgi:hypothetical protein
MIRHTAHLLSIFRFLWFDHLSYTTTLSRTEQQPILEPERPLQCTSFTPCYFVSEVGYLLAAVCRHSLALCVLGYRTPRTTDSVTADTTETTLAALCMFGDIFCLYDSAVSNRYVHKVLAHIPPGIAAHTNDIRCKVMSCVRHACDSQHLS